MSRATRISVFIVSGLSPLTSRAQASDVFRSAPVEVTAIAAANPVADRWRNRRLDRPSRTGALWVAVIASPPASRFAFERPLVEAAEFLQHFDLVAVGILDEEEAGDLSPLVVELDDLARLQAFGLETPMFRIEIVDDESDMAVAVAERVRLGPPLVDRQFDLIGNLGIRQIDEGEVGEIEALSDVEPESLLVKCERPLLVQSADHRVDRLRHSSPVPLEAAICGGLRG